MASAVSSSTNQHLHHANGNSQVKRALNTKRKELRERLSDRLHDVAAYREPDDEAALAVNNYANDLVLVTMSREQRELDEIEAALRRLYTGEYGICQTCETPIGQARL